jgi:hypothetical protein
MRDTDERIAVIVNAEYGVPLEVHPVDVRR